MKEKDIIKADNSELCALRKRVETIEKRSRFVLYYHIFCIGIFVLLLFKLVYGAGTFGSPASAIWIAIAAAIALCPIVVLMILSFSKNIKATVIFILTEFFLFAVILFQTTINEIFVNNSSNLAFPCIAVLAPCYILVVFSLFYKSKKPFICASALALIIYVIFCLDNELYEVTYPHILLFFGAILNILNLRQMKEYDALSKIYGFPYFNERFNEQTNEYESTYSTNNFISDTPDDISADYEKINLDASYASGDDLMEKINIADDSSDVCDVPFSEKAMVDEYTQKLRNLKNKK